MRALRKLAAVRIKMFFRDPVALFFCLVFPSLLLVLFGLIFGNKPDPVYSPRYGYVDSEAPGLVGIVVATLAFQTIPVSMTAARERKVLRRLSLTPLRASQYLAADVIVYLAIAVLGSVMLGLLGKAVFGMHFEPTILRVLGGLILCCLAFFSTGYLLASISPSVRSAQLIGNSLFFPMMFLCGAAIPLKVLPPRLQHLSEALPLTYAVRFLQGLWLGDSWGDHLHDIAVLVGMMVVGGVLAAKTFRWE
jgi:ABC-2 type transport system permease protein